MLSNGAEIFIAVAENGSFSAAARKLYVTPTAIIKQVNLFEEKLGVVLFNRNKRGVTLTREGQSLYEDAKDIEKFVDDAIRRAKSIVNPDEVVRIGISLMTPWQNLSRILPKIQKIYPDLKFQLVTFKNSQRESLNLLSNLQKDIDLVFATVSEEVDKRISTCKSIVISQEKLCLAVPLTNPLSQKSKLSISDLNGQTVMLGQPGWSKSINELKKFLEEKTGANVSSFSHYEMDVFTNNSNGALIVVTQIVDEMLPLYRVLPVDWEFVMPYGVYYNAKPNRAVQKFLDALNI